MKLEIQVYKEDLSIELRKIEGTRVFLPGIDNGYSYAVHKKFELIPITTLKSFYQVSEISTGLAVSKCFATKQGAIKSAVKQIKNVSDRDFRERVNSGLQRKQKCMVIDLFKGAGIIE